MTNYQKRKEKNDEYRSIAGVCRHDRNDQSRNGSQFFDMHYFLRYADAEAYMLDKVITLPLYKVVSWEMTHVNDYSKIYAPYGIQINKFKNWETSVDLYTTEDYAKLAAIYEANAAK